MVRISANKLSANKWGAGLTGLILVMLLSACQTVTERAALSRDQIVLLQQQGFRLTEEGWALSFTDRLLFEVDSSRLNARSRAAVVNISQALRSVGITRMRIEGHADAEGADAYNNRLSLQRANAVAHVLAESGIEREHMVVVGMGKSKPVAENDTAAGRAENRRVSIIIAAQ